MGEWANGKFVQGEWYVLNHAHVAFRASILQWCPCTGHPFTLTRSLGPILNDQYIPHPPQRATTTYATPQWTNVVFGCLNRILKDGTIFKGKFKNNCPLEGTFSFAKTGNVVAGSFDKQGYFIEKTPEHEESC
eukprot:9485545-Pyramimonas_sp.AAC.1